MVKKRIFCVLLVLLLLLSACSPSSGRKPTPPGEVLATGRCGDNVTWTLDSNGLFTVSGTGTMTNYGGITGKSPPWYEHRDKIKSVVIENGVTSVGRYAFIECSNLTSVTIPDSVTVIAKDAFSDTPWLESLGTFAVVNGILIKYQGYGGDIVIPDSVSTIGYGAFLDCKSLTGVTIPASVTRILDSAFEGCSSLTLVNYGGSDEQWDRIGIGENNSPLTRVKGQRDPDPHGPPRQ